MSLTERVLSMFGLKRAKDAAAAELQGAMHRLQRVLGEADECVTRVNLRTSPPRRSLDPSIHPLRRTSGRRVDD